jgi:hypothetical protein
MRCARDGFRCRLVSPLPDSSRFAIQHGCDTELCLEKSTMKKSRMLMLASLIACSSAAWAASASNEGAPSGGGGGAVDAALKTCASSAAKDSRGGPDQAAMTACMTKAGFTKPDGGGQHRGPGNPPERK